jgi:hypothetical protein
MKIDLLKIDDDCLKEALKNHLDQLAVLDILAIHFNRL